MDGHDDLQLAMMRMGGFLGKVGTPHYITNFSRTCILILGATWIKNLPLRATHGKWKSPRSIFFHSLVLHLSLLASLIVCYSQKAGKRSLGQPLR